jgi:hypothetical protein
MQTLNPIPRPSSRRTFLSGATLSGSALLLLAGCSNMSRGGTAMAATAANPAQDVEILNIALGLEHQAIGAYQIGAESGLLQRPVLETAVLFQGHHKSHRDALAAAVRQMGGRPVEAMTNAQYATQLNAARIANQADILKLALELEKGAAEAYLSVIPSFKSTDLAKVSARLASDEVMHWTVLQQALQMPIPQPALSFGV